MSMNSVHASSLCETNNRLLCAFFSGTHEGQPDVAIYLAAVTGEWIDDGVKIAGGNEPHWNPVLWFNNDILYCWFLRGPFQEWKSYLIRSFDGGRTWSEPEPLPKGFMGPTRNKPILRNNGTILCPSSTELGGWKVHLEVWDTYDLWRKIKVYSGGYEAIQPTLLAWLDRPFQMLCRTSDGVIVTASSEDDGETWGALRRTGLPNPNSAIDAIMLQDGRAVLAYNDAQADRRSRLSGILMGPRMPLNLALSSDGEKWEPWLTLEEAIPWDPESGTKPPEFSYPSLIQTRDGKVHVSYTWNRTKIRHRVLEVPS